MMSYVDIVVLIAFFILFFYLIWKNKASQSFKEFATGENQIPYLFIFASISATAIGPGYSMAITDQAASNGYIWWLIPCAFCVQMIISGLFIAPRINKLKNVLTVGDIMGKQYGKTVQIMTGIISTLFCLAFIGGLSFVSGELISSLIPINKKIAIIISSLVVMFYSGYGGLKTVVLTDSIQFCILAIIIPTLVLILIFTLPDHSITMNPLVVNSLEFNTGESITPFSKLLFINLFLGFLLGEMLIPPYVTRAIASKSDQSAKKAFLMTGGFAFFWFLILATVGILIAQNYSDYGSAFIFSLGLLPQGLMGLGIAAFLSIILSTQDSLYNSAAVSFTNDVLKQSNISNDRLLSTSKIITIALGIFSLIVALYVPSIIKVLMIGYKIWAPTIIIPLIFALYYKKSKPSAALGAIIVGGISTQIISNLYPHLPAILIGVGLNIITFLTIQIITTWKS